LYHFEKLGPCLLYMSLCYFFMCFPPCPPSRGHSPQCTPCPLKSPKVEQRPPLFEPIHEPIFSNVEGDTLFFFLRFDKKYVLFVPKTFSVPSILEQSALLVKLTFQEADRIRTWPNFSLPRPSECCVSRSLILPCICWPESTGSFSHRPGL